MKNHGDPRQVVRWAVPSVHVKKANGENSRSAVKAPESGCDRDLDRRQVHPAEDDQEQHERGAREADPAAQRDTEQRAAE